MIQLIVRIRRLLGELDYAQRRTLELRTGTSMTGPREASRRARHQISEFDSLWCRAVDAENTTGERDVTRADHDSAHTPDGT